MLAWCSVFLDVSRRSYHHLLMRYSLLLLTGLSVLLAGCGLVAVHPAASPPLECVAHFVSWDQRVADAGVGDGGSHRLAGYPYLRSNRFLASFGDGIAADPADSVRVSAWLEHLRRLDMQARRIELQNLGIADVDAQLERLEACGTAALQQLKAADLDAIAQAAKVPDDYSMAARVLGAYPLALPFMRLGIERFQAELREDFQSDLWADPQDAELRLWLPPSDIASRHTLTTMRRDVLGIPVLSEAQWQQLAQRHAPAWWIETAGDFDQPGRPVRREGRPAIDTGDAVVYYQTAHTLFGDQVLPQIAYVMWFSQRPPAYPLDPYAGDFDGLIWRVTVDEQGNALVYDSIHPCGCYHQFFSPAGLPRAEAPGFDEEPILTPQTEVPARDVALRVQSATHYLRRILPRDDIDDPAQRHYVLRPYDDLLTLDIGDGVTRSLFDPCGMLSVSSRLERFWLWPSGVRNPGAMRQWGRHATAFLGRTHFDDARLLEKVYRPE